jgi:hypothetical protein
VAAATVVVGAASFGAAHSASRTGRPAAGGPAVGPSPACHATKCEAASREVPYGGAMGAPDFDVYATLTRMLPSGGSIRDIETQPGYWVPRTST